MSLFSSSQPTQEEIMKEIQKMESLVKTYEEQLEAVNNRTLPSTEQSTKTEPFVPKNRIQAVYYQNMKNSLDADRKFDSLLYKDDEKMEKTLRKPQDYDFCEKNEEIFQEILPDLTKIVKGRLEKLEKKNIENGNLFKKLRYEWWAKNRITIDDVRNENTRFKDQLAVVPPMLNDEEKRNCFISTNHLTASEKVLQQYQETRILEEIWTEEEKKTFVDKFTKTPKDMRVIASYLPNKTTGDVVTFYYNYKLTEDFKKMKNELKLSQKYRKRFVDEGKRKDYNEPESPMTPLEPIFTKDAKVAAAENRANVAARNKKKEEEELLAEWSQAEITKFKNHFTKFGADFSKIAQKLKTRDEAQCKQFFEDNKVKLKLVAANTNTKDANKKKKTQAASTVASTTNTTPAVISSSSTAIPPPSTTSPATKKITKEVPEKKEVTPVLPPSTPPAGITKPNKTKKILKIVSIWTVSERDAFLEYFREYGRDWKTIAELIPTKTETQIRNLFLNYKVKLGLTLPTKRRKKKKSPIPYVESNPEVATPDLFTLSVLAGEVQDKGSPLDESPTSSIENRPQRSLSTSLQVSNNSQLRKNKKAKKGAQSPSSIDVLASVSCNQYIPSLQDLIQSYQTSASNAPSSQTPNDLYLPPVQQQSSSSHYAYPQHQSPPSMHSNTPEEHKYSRSMVAPTNIPQQSYRSQPETDSRDGIIMRTLVNQGTSHVTNSHTISLDSTHHIVNDINLTSTEILTPTPYQGFQERLARLPPMDGPMTSSHFVPEPKKNDTTEIVLEEGGFGDSYPAFDQQQQPQHLPPINNMSLRHNSMQDIQQPFMNMPPQHNSSLQHHPYGHQQ